MGKTMIERKKQHDQLMFVFYLTPSISSIVIESTSKKYFLTYVDYDLRT